MMLLDGQELGILLDSRDSLVGNLQMSELKTVDLVFFLFLLLFLFSFSFIFLFWT